MILTLTEKPVYKGIRAMCSLKAPNQEVLGVYEEIIDTWFQESLPSSDEHRQLLGSLVTGDVKTFGKIFQTFLLTSMSYHDIPIQEPEKVYHAFVLGLLIGLKDTHEVKSNRESGYGRYDVSLIPYDKKQLGIILEFKIVDKDDKETLETCAEKALLQIEEKQYVTELAARGITQVVCLGLAFLGKKVLIKEHRVTL